MIVFVAQITYWLFTGVVLLGLFFRNAVILRRLSPWSPPASLTDHSGAALPANCRFFRIPHGDGQLIRSAEVSPFRRSSTLEICLQACLGATFGSAWAGFGVWLCSIPTGVVQYSLFAVSAAMWAWQSARDWRRGCITYVCADTFGLVTINVSGSGKYFLPNWTHEAHFDVGSIDGGDQGDSTLSLNVSDGVSSRIVMLNRIRFGVEREQWRRWIIAVRDAVEDLRWSKSLCHIAMTAPRVRDVAMDCKAPMAVRFDVLSVLHEQRRGESDFVRSNDGRFIRLPAGRIGFLEDGLVVENLTPLYEALRRINSLSSGIHLASQVGSDSDAMTEVGQVVKRWRTDHVLAFPVETIESIEEEGEIFTIRPRNGKSLEFQMTQVVGFPTLRRLMQSEIWSAHIEEALRRQMAEDIKQLQESVATTCELDSVFGQKLPKHRALVWDAAYKLRVSNRLPGDRADELTRRVFHDSQKLLRKSSYTDGYFLDVFLGWKDFNDNETLDESSLQLSAKPELEGGCEEANGSTPVGH